MHQLLTDAVRRFINKIHGGASLSSAVADVETGTRGINLWREDVNQATRNKYPTIIMSHGVERGRAEMTSHVSERYLRSLHQSPQLVDDGISGRAE